MGVRAWLLLHLLAFAAQPSRSQPSSGVVNVPDADTFVTALRAAFQGGLNTTTVLKLQQDVALTVPWSQPPPEKAGTTAVIEGYHADGDNRRQLDARMRQNLLQDLSLGPAQLVIRNVNLINLCSDAGTPVNDMGTAFIASEYGYIWGRRTNIETQVHINMTVYVPADEIAATVWWLVVLSSKLPPMQAYATWFVGRTTNVQAVVQDITPHSLVYASTHQPNSIDTNYELHSTSDSDSPPHLRLPSLGGTLMPHQFCNGTVLNPRQPLTYMKAPDGAVNYFRVPVWIINQTGALGEALVDMEDYTARASDPAQTTQSLYSIVFLTDPVSLPAAIQGLASSVAPDYDAADSDSPDLNTTAYNLTGISPINSSLGSAPTHFSFNRTICFHGSFNHVPASKRHSQLDLGYGSNLFTITGAARHLFFIRIILSGLASQPLGTTLAGQSAAAAQLRTALPLWAFNISRPPPGNQTAYTTPLLLENCTMVVPRQDYTALLTAALAALRGASWQSTSPLMSGVTSLVVSPGQNLTQDSTCIMLTYIAAFGWQASYLLVKLEPAGPSTGPPSATSPSNVLNPFQPAPSLAADTGAAGDDDSLSSRLALPLGLALGLGGGLLLVAGAAFAGWRMCRTNYRCPSSSEYSANLGATNSKGDCDKMGLAERNRQSSDSNYSFESAQRSDLHGEGATPTTPVHVALDVVQEEDGGASGQLHQGSGQHLASGRVATIRRSQDRPSDRSSGASADLTNGQPLIQRQQEAGLQQLQHKGSTKSRSSVESSSGPSTKRSLSASKSDAVQAVAAGLGVEEAEKLQIVGLIAQTRWGAVYQGEWRGLKVAVKTVLLSGRQDGRGSLPFERGVAEAAVAISMSSHRNIVSTYHYLIQEVAELPGVGSGDQDSLKIHLADPEVDLAHKQYKLSLVLEWCDTTLEKAMRQGNLHNPQTGEPMMDLVLSGLQDACQGLHHLHSRGIIHGDLKPSNLLLKADSSSPVGAYVKVADFGLSHILAPDETHASVRSGTPGYTAPEVMAHGRATMASDIYAIGVCMWELFSGQGPMVEGPDGVHSRNPAYLHFPPNTPVVYLQLARWCLSHDPKLRPSTTEIIRNLKVMHLAWLRGYDTLCLPPVAAVPHSTSTPALTKSPTGSMEEPTVAVSATDSDSHGGGQGASQDAADIGCDVGMTEAALLEAHGKQPQSTRQLWSCASVTSNH